MYVFTKFEGGEGGRPAFTLSRALTVLLSYDLIISTYRKMFSYV